MPSKLALLTLTCAPVALAFFAPVPISNHQLNGVFKSTTGGNRQRQTPLHMAESLVDKARIVDESEKLRKELTADKARISEESEKLRKELTEFSALSKKKATEELAQLESERKKAQHKIIQFFSPESAREKARSIVNNEIAEIEAEREKIRKQIAESDKARELEIAKIEADRVAREKQIAKIEADRVKIQKEEIAKIEAERVAREKQIAKFEADKVRIQQEISESAKKREQLRLEIVDAQNAKEKLKTDIAATNKAKQETHGKLNMEIAKQEELIAAKRKKLEEINLEPMGVAALMKAAPGGMGVAAIAVATATLAGGRQLLSQRQTVKEERVEAGTQMAANRQARTVPAFGRTRQLMENDDSHHDMDIQDGQVFVQGCGLTLVNGVYEQSGTVDRVGKYTMEGTWNNKKETFSMFRCPVSDNTKRWYISIVPKNMEPGTDMDIDFYSAPVVDNDSQYPPSQGWAAIGEGTDPSPAVDWSRVDWV